MKYPALFYTLLAFVILFLSHQTFPQGNIPAKQKIYSESIEPIFEHITVKDGLPENTLLAIYQDHFGYIWLGTQSGLVRYDGYEMKTYPHIPGDSLSLSDSRVTTIYEDRSGILWVGTFSGLNCFDREKEKFQQFKIGSGDSSKEDSKSIYGLCEDENNNFWVGTNSGLYKLNRKNGESKIILFKDKIYKPDVYNYLNTLIGQRHLIQNISNAGNSADISKSFFLKNRTPVMIVVMGDDGNDYGYLEDNKGNIIYSYDQGKSIHAGGLTINRIQITIDTLDSGNYTLHYKSNYSYSPQDGFTKETDYYFVPIGEGPAHPEFWGIQVFDVSGDLNKAKQLIDEPVSIFNNAEVFFVVQSDINSQLYFGTICPGLWQIDETGSSIIRANVSVENTLDFNVGSFRAYHKSKNGLIWIASSNGVLSFNASQNKLKFYSPTPSQSDLSKTEFSTITEGDDGIIWAGTAKKGLFYFNPATEIITGVVPKTYFEDRFRLNDILSSYTDRSGVLWVGTWPKGLEKWDKKKYKLKQYSFAQLAKDLKSSLNVFTMVEDYQGVVWLGTDNGLISYNRRNGKSYRYSNDPNNSNSISNNDIYQIIKDPDYPEIIWIATAGGLNKLNCRTKQFQCYKIRDEKLSESSLNLLAYIFEDSEKRFWVCSQNGLYTFDKKSGTFDRFLLEPTDPNFSGKNPSHERVYHIYEDKQHLLWMNLVGVGGGLIWVDPSDKKFKTYKDFSNGDYYVAATAYCEDSDSNLWVGDFSSGLHLFDRKNETSLNYSDKAHLKNNTVYSLLTDNSDNLWILTELDLSRYNPVTGETNSYSQDDGLIDMSLVYYDLLYKNSKGEIFVGGKNGFNIFEPDSLKNDMIPPSVVISKISLYNRPNEKLNYNGYISELKEIDLPYSQNNLRIDYVALHFGEPSKNQYKYVLENFDNDWINAGTQRNATYTNLNPGEYVFRVIASNRDGIWNEQGTFIKILINPPWWQTTWAYILYFLGILSILYMVWKIQLRRIRIKHEFEMSKFEAQKLHEVDELKSRFFTNISHEFRTPLTLILGPIKQMITRLSDGKMKEDLNIVHRNANKLLGLVNQLLDISKIESGNMKLQASPQNIIQVIKVLVLSFTSYAERKKITLNFNSTQDEIMVYLDKDKIDKIITNLLSNAFKFTPDGGEIEVSVKRDDKFVNVSVNDNGIGIPKENLDKIFDRFYQVDGSHTRKQEGTGIGLSLTKELVELHKGRIEVESEEGRGATFIISLPLGSEHLHRDEIREPIKDEEKLSTTPADSIFIEDLKSEDSEKNSGKIDPDLIDQSEKPLLLLVEDNSDVRKYIKENLIEGYVIMEAVDGEDGWEKSIENTPDLIVSDVMMPRMDGFELCKKLKTDERTSHIPVILVTAKAAKEDKLGGYEIGADDYIMKPFEPDELKVRIKNLIEQRKRLQDHFRKQGIAGIERQKITSFDKRFLQKLLDIIKNKISDSEFSVEYLANELAISRSVLQRKVFSLTGESPVELIRRIRLNRAAELIENKFGNISEIALEVGFSNPAYFADCFKKQYGVTPTQYQRGNKSS